MRIKHALAASLAASVIVPAAGCAGTDDSGPDAPATSAASHGTDHEHDHDHDRAAAPHATTIEDAALASAPFEPLGAAPQGEDSASGTVWIARADGSVTVSAELRGLEPEATYTSHLHVQACADDSGGEHFKFDPEGPATPPNEVHLSFGAGADGTASDSVRLDRDITGARSIVVHGGPDHAKLICADLPRPS